MYTQDPYLLRGWLEDTPQIEGEALAVPYALHQIFYRVLGCTDLIIATDHKPPHQDLNDVCRLKIMFASLV